MVGTDSEMVSQGEVQSSLHSEQQRPENHGVPSLGRQSSIYSLTLDEFQTTLFEGGKNFGSMNMDEFLSSIWTAEENQAHAQAHTTTATVPITNYNNPLQIDQTNTSADHQKATAKQPSLSRQGSLTLPPPLSRKTVEEVWADIHKTQQEQQNIDGVDVAHTGSTQRQATFGEMTLEDFLVKAGIVREKGDHPPPPSQPQPYGMVAPFASRPVMPLVGATGSATPGVNVAGGYQPFPQIGAAKTSTYNPGGIERADVYTQHPPGVYGGRVRDGTAGGYGQAVPGMAMASPVSPVSSDGFCANPIDGNQYGFDVGEMRGSRKRVIDGPIGKVVERRQRRMIKNRESAARSRARKQAYTVELEAELNQLKEDNAHLRQALAEMERRRKQQYLQEMKMKTQTKVQKANEKLGVLRRSFSCP